MRRSAGAVLIFVVGSLFFAPTQASAAAVGGCAGGEDYNGDGFADLAIGVPGEDIGLADSAGAVQVMYGAPGGTSSAGDQVFHQDTAGMNDTAQSSDSFGSAVASGDFDEDGFDDLAVGVPFEDLGGTDEGAVQIIYGSPAGLSSSGDQVFHRDTPDIEDDPVNDDAFGYSVAACDFNGDGRDDLAIGVFADDVGGSGAAGSVSVLYGGSAGLSAAGDQVFHQDVLNDTPENDDSFGRFMIAGDFDADGRGDLAVSVTDEGLSPTLLSVGAVHVIYGSDSGLTATGNELFTQDTPGMNETAEPDDRFGFSLAAGDFDADGFDDLAVGVINEAIGGLQRAGAMHVIYGTADGLSPDGDQVFHQESAGMNDTSEPEDRFGFALTAGDFDGDGFDDVGVGVSGEQITGDFQGAVQILYGGGSGLSSGGDQVFHQDTPGMNDTAEDFDNFGGRLTSGDFHGDGFDDVVVGVQFEDLGGDNQGSVHVINSAGADGLSSLGDQIFHQDTPGMNDTAENSDLFGGALVGSSN